MHLHASVHACLPVHASGHSSLHRLGSPGHLPAYAARCRHCPYVPAARSPLPPPPPAACPLRPASRQAWLNALLEPGQLVPDGALAHIHVADRHMCAVWVEQASAWVLAECCPAAPPSLSLSFMWTARCCGWGPAAQPPRLLRSVCASCCSGRPRARLLPASQGQTRRAAWRRRQRRRRAGPLRCSPSCSAWHAAAGAPACQSPSFQQRSS